MISDVQLQEWNRRGLIPGPAESEDQFAQRVELTLKIGTREEVDRVVNEALKEVSALYDISPDWVPIFYSNRGLGLWHGGGTVLDYVGGHVFPSVQLRSALQATGRYLGFYRIEEFLAHELVHVGRVAFEEHGFEEILAYRTSRSAFRRIFGPIARSGFEAWLFVMVLLVSISLDYFFYAMGWLEAALWTIWLYLFPLGLLIYGFWRLGRAHRIFRQCIAALTALTGDSDRARYVLYRLTDSEMRLFAKSTPEDIRVYVSSQRSIRWKVIKQTYFNLAG